MDGMVPALCSEHVRISCTSHVSLWEPARRKRFLQQGRRKGTWSVRIVRVARVDLVSRLRCIRRMQRISVSSTLAPSRPSTIHVSCPLRIVSFVVRERHPEDVHRRKPFQGFCLRSFSIRIMSLPMAKKYLPCADPASTCRECPKRALPHRTNEERSKEKSKRYITSTRPSHLARKRKRIPTAGSPSASSRSSRTLRCASISFPFEVDSTAWNHVDESFLVRGLEWDGGSKAVLLFFFFFFFLVLLQLLLPFELDVVNVNEEETGRRDGSDSSLSDGMQRFVGCFETRRRGTNEEPRAFSRKARGIEFQEGRRSPSSFFRLRRVRCLVRSLVRPRRDGVGRRASER